MGQVGIQEQLARSPRVSGAVREIQRIEMQQVVNRRIVSVVLVSHLLRSVVPHEGAIKAKHLLNLGRPEERRLGALGNRLLGAQVLD